MSYSSTTSSRKCFCATCKKAGEPESVYTSHFTKDTPGGRVVCPTIKGFKCRECGESGHIANAKYCPVLRATAASSASLVANVRVERVSYGGKKGVAAGPSVASVASVAATNRFALAFSSSLSDSEDDNIVKKEVKKEEKKKSGVIGPGLIGPGVIGPAAAVVSLGADSQVRSYRDILNKPLPVVLSKNEVVLNFQVLNSSSSGRVTTFKLAAKTRRCWADDSSSDEDDD